MSEFSPDGVDRVGVFGNLNAAEPQPRSFSYITPRRRRWRWEVVEYKGTAINTAFDGGSMTFEAAGPITRTVHPRRFWLRRSVHRYLERMKPPADEE